MITELSQHSEALLATVHPDLQKVIRIAFDKGTMTFNVSQAMRTADEEMAIWLSCHNIDGTRNDQPWKTNCNGYAPGTVAPNGIKGTGVSNHQGGLAVDLAVIVDGKAVWDIESYKNLANLILATAAELKIPLVWGGSFSTPDNDHFELNHNFYK